MLYLHYFIVSGCKELDTSLGTITYDLDHKCNGVDYCTKTRANYKCFRGTILHGPNERVCLNDGTWSGDTKCELVGCSYLNTTPHGRILYRDSDEMRSIAAVYECEEGYSLIGNKTRICLPNEQWSGSAPMCMKCM